MLTGSGELAEWKKALFMRDHFMEKRKINLTHIANDIKLGITDEQIMHKYRISNLTLRKACAQLVKINAITQQDIGKRGSKIKIFKCPKCNDTAHEYFDECHNCGVYTTKYQETTSDNNIKKRVLCGDGCCIGIINKNGICTECGRTLKKSSLTGVYRLPYIFSTKIRHFSTINLYFL